MQAEINARHFTLKEEQREIIEAALDKMEKFVPRPMQSFRITIDHDAGHFAADAVLHLKNHEFRAKGEGVEPEYAVNELVESLKKQLTKFKERISGKQKGGEGGLGKAILAEGVGYIDEPVTEGLQLPDLDIEGAMVRFTGGTLPFLVFRNSANDRLGVIYRRDDGTLGHMEAAEN